MINIEAFFHRVSHQATFRDLCQSILVTHPQSTGRQNLFARDWMDDGKVPLHADDDQDEYRGRVAHAVHKLIHLAEEVAKHPTESERIRKSKSEWEVRGGGGSSVF